MCAACARSSRRMGSTFARTWSGARDTGTIDAGGTRGTACGGCFGEAWTSGHFKAAMNFGGGDVVLAESGLNFHGVDDEEIAGVCATSRCSACRWRGWICGSHLGSGWFLCSGWWRWRFARLECAARGGKGGNPGRFGKFGRGCECHGIDVSRLNLGSDWLGCRCRHWRSCRLDDSCQRGRGQRGRVLYGGCHANHAGNGERLGQERGMGKIRLQDGLDRVGRVWGIGDDVLPPLVDQRHRRGA